MSEIESRGEGEASSAGAALVSTVRARRRSERFKGFIDASVAIALTLLILPLMESVAEITDAGEVTLGGWLHENVASLIAFVVSFVIIAMFWIMHHGLFAHVSQVSGTLTWLGVGWLLTVVWLPVVTALSVKVTSHDPGIKALYIGSMVLTSLMLVIIALYVRAHPELHDLSSIELAHHLGAVIAMAVLFAVAMAISLLVPASSYFPLFILVLTGWLVRLFARPFKASTKPGTAVGEV